MHSRIAVVAMVAVVAMALAVGASVVFAQGEGHGAMGHGMHHEFMGGGPGLDLPLHELNLTEDQHTQIKQIFQTEKGNMKPLMQQEFQVHQQLIQLITSGNFDQAKAAAILAQGAQTHLQLEVEHAKIASQIYQLLSSDQKTKVGDMLAKHQQMMQQHLQNQDQGPSDQQ